MSVDPYIGFTDPVPGNPGVVQQINDALHALSAASHKMTTKSGALGADVTLDLADGQSGFIQFTYVLSADVSVKLPVTAARLMYVYNNTTGASWTLTVKTVTGGSTGVIVPRGFSMWIWHDGTNVYPATIPVDTSGRVPQVRAYHNANQSIADAIPFMLALNSERWDFGNFHDTVTNNSRLTVPPGFAGEYDIYAHVAFAVGTTGARAVDIILNGATFIGGLVNPPVGVFSSGYSVPTSYRLVAGDYIQARVFHTQGAALNVEALANRSPELGMKMVGL